MGIAMDDGQVASQMVAREQIWRTIKQPCVKILPLGRYYLTIPVGEPRELNSQIAQDPVPGRRIVPSPDRDTEPSIVPPRGMDTRESLHDLLGLLCRRWQRPRGCDEMRIRKVFQQQMPCTGICRLDGLKTVGHQSFRQRRGNVAVE